MNQSEGFLKEKQKKKQILPILEDPKEERKKKFNHSKFLIHVFAIRNGAMHRWSKDSQF